MATYSELFDLKNNSALKNRVIVAIIIAAEAVMADVSVPVNKRQRDAWAAAVFANPKSEADRMFWALIAANEAADVAQITGATDAAILANVEAHIDLFAGC